MYYVDPLNNNLYKSERKAALFLSDHIAIKALTYSSTHSHGMAVSCDLHFHIPYTLRKRPRTYQKGGEHFFSLPGI